MDDVYQVVNDKDVINFYYGNIDLSEDICFNFIKNDNSDTLLIIETNKFSSFKDIKRILDSIRNNIGNTNLIYGTYIDENMPMNVANVVVINTGKRIIELNLKEEKKH